MTKENTTMVKENVGGVNVDHIIKSAEKFVNTTPASKEEIKYQRGKNIVIKPRRTHRHLFTSSR